ncbi:MAG: septum formation initiator family protein [Paramuribaculum sp.]|nr:septum formation initiator family protein [Paramuribaculum sp.]
MDWKWNSIVGWCRRYIRVSFLLMVGILGYVMLFSDNSVMDNYRYQKEIDRLSDEIALNNDTLQYYQKLLDQLTTEPEAMERIVREQYHMQRVNEDIFIAD